ncbi:LOW QUALITY PROTEIN: MAM and LDL-receptor class A domain-containing protein 1-like [Drosophila eugracilis]|uniref:LOW QUALITY PROTEIN: MAM and LDL-receptor class A domain-containing protein 1-like n=1 Tax=Drosophila eugracilis TaxID=29029 RepID=UPI001BDB2A1A|nr:LOW QUALITY PROTEIN: MAM and LDL-receptor class A domain-containing protein 1-like [Drosophila eugracilis]
MALASVFWALAMLVLLTVGESTASCDLEIKLANGRVRESSSWFPGDYIKFECDLGYSLQGKTWHLGSGSIPRRFCTKSGCNDLAKPEKGIITTTDDGLKAEIACDEGFVLTGNRLTYCNGTQWIIPLGTCQAASYASDYSCDFEREDQCGWKASKAIPQPWTRTSAASDYHRNMCLHQDHTFQNGVEGHFIRLQLQVHASRTYHFVSPILPRNLTLGNSLRFHFQLFMSGTRVKDLTVSVKPESMAVEEMWLGFKKNSTKLTVSGDQGASWKSHSVPIQELNTDFQVVFTVADPSSLSGEIGIDDVRFIKEKV